MKIIQAIKPTKTFLDSFRIKVLMYGPLFLEIFAKKTKGQEVQDNHPMENKIIDNADMFVELAELADVAIKKRSLIAFMTLSKTINEYIWKLALLFGLRNEALKDNDDRLNFCLGDINAIQQMSAINDLLPTRFKKYAVNPEEANEFWNDIANKIFYVDNDSVKSCTIKEFRSQYINPIIKKIKEIQRIFFIIAFPWWSVPFTSSNYLEALEAKIEPEKGSQYWAAPWFVKYVEQNFTDKEYTYFISGESLNMDNCNWE